MLVVHGLWRGADRLCLWGEDSARPERPPRRAGRPPRQQQHPFAAPHDVLAAALADPGTLGELASKATTATAALLLPSRGGGPLASPELVRTELADEAPARPAREPITLRPWLAPILEYDQDDALAVLRALGGEQVAPGAALRHLRAVADFAVDLVTRGRLLPTVLPTTPGAGTGGSGGAPGPRAAWRPVLTGSDAAWARSLGLAMPPAGRAWAEAADHGTTQPAADADPASGSGAGGAALAHAIDALVDAAARAALDGYRPPRTGRPKRKRPAKAPAKAEPAATAAPATRAATAATVEAAASAWREALTGRQRYFTADPAAVTALAEELAGWQGEALGGAVRACFRLVEPASESPTGDTLAGDGSAGEQWQLEFALQATDEPSLVVDADRVWRSRGALRALARHLEAPQETLLAELGRANRLYPPLAAALRAARPSVLPIDASGAHQFLREGAPLLAGAGFGVLLPGWWSKPSAKLGVRLHASAPTAPGTVAGTSAMGMESIVDYQWELALGDEPLSAAELRALTKLKAPLVRLRGKWVELDPRRLAAGLKVLAQTSDGDGAGTMTVAELLNTALSTADGPAGLTVTGVTADGWLGELLSGEAEHRLRPVPAPAGFHGTLRPYQERGLSWLAFLQSLGLGGILADDMGLGKTVQLLALLARDRDNTAAPPGPTLLVCPMSLVGNWQREAERFAPALRVHVHHGAERPRGKEFAAAVREADLVVTTYALAARDAGALADIEWHRLVVDEAQAIKNAATRQATAIRKLPARHRIAVTGTPVENRLADLWSIMEFANPGLLGPAAAFRQRFAEPVERHGDEEAAARLRRLTTPFILRRVKSDKSIISDLPEKLEMEVVCNLTSEQASLYQAVVDDMLAKIEQSEGIERRGLVLATMTKLKQVCNHPAQLLHDGSRLAGRSGKLARLEEILDEVLAASERALLFTQYAQFGAMLRGHLSARFAREVAFLHGGVGKAERDAMVRRFQGSPANPGQAGSDQTGSGRVDTGRAGAGRAGSSRAGSSHAGDPGAPPIFVLSLKAGGTGLTLTAANHVIHVDRWWNPAVEDQATDRAYRIGQRRAVQVRKFVCAGTVEEKVAAMIRDKRGLAARIVGTGEQWLTELSTTELRELFTLDAGAVVE